MKIVRQCCLYLSRRCNLNCSYCQVPKNLKGELDTQSWIRILNLVKEKFDSPFVVFFGGEPYLRDDIGEIIDEINKLGLEYTLISNGSLDKEEVIRKLKGFTLSIDRAEHHKGMDEQAKSNWAMLKKYNGIVPDLVANVTVTKSNIDELNDIVLQLNDMNIWVIFSWLLWNGRPGIDKFRSNCPELGIRTEEDFNKFEKAFWLVKKRHTTDNFVDVVKKHYKRLDWRYEQTQGAPQYCIIDSDGTFIADPDYWGKEVKTISIFDNDFTAEKWQELARYDLASPLCPGSLWNHLVQLAYPDSRNLLEHNGENTTEKPR